MVERTRLFIGGLPDGAQREEIEEAFGKYGKLNDIWIARRPPGFGFVIFDDERDAKEAVRRLDGRRVCGEVVKVEFARDRRTQNSRDGSRYRSEDKSCYNCNRIGHIARDCPDGDRNGHRRSPSRSRRHRDDHSSDRSRSRRRRHSSNRRSRSSSSPRRSAPPPQRGSSRSYSRSP